MKTWPDADRKKALVQRHLRRQGEIPVLLYQWIASLEQRIKHLENRLYADSIVTKPRSST
jgi:hypothetical protein